MKIYELVSCTSVIAVFLFSQTVSASTVDVLLDTYQQQGAGPFSAEAGQLFWGKIYSSKDGGQDRQCATCHSDDLTKPSKHVKTGKVIEPLAPSVNSQRFTDEKKIEKWFKRNCKWTLGRECSAQEKGDLLMFLIKQ